MGSGQAAELGVDPVAGATAAAGLTALDRSPPPVSPPDELDARSVAVGLEMALRARAAAIYVTTPLVRELCVRLCQAVAVDAREQRLVDICARVRDVGMLALPDSVIGATGALAPSDWELVNRHPLLGAELLGQFPGLRAAVPVVRSHHERWDGDGYPDGISGEAIPLLSRVIAVCDAFVAMAIDRPHRRGVGAEVALEQVAAGRGRQFDPAVVDGLVSVVAGAAAAGPKARPTPASKFAEPEARVSGPGGRSRLHAAIAAVDVLPAFAPAVDRVLSALEGEESAASSDAVAAIESDTGLTVAVLREASGTSGRRPITTVSGALGLMTAEQARALVRSVPRAAFPWRSSSEALLHHLRVHSQAVARAAQRLARELELGVADELFTAALLHDVGKLVLAPALAGTRAGGESTSAPEVRVREERRIAGLDHASVGGLLLTRWGLPQALSDAVAAHHSAEEGGDIAMLVRLADMAAHHMHGDQVDRRLMLRLAATAGLNVQTLRDVLFDLPHLGGSQRRRAEPSPLSAQQTAVLRRLADGKRYKEIGQDLGLSASTVRSHLHNAYAKLRVTDRAQAVLLATEKAWI